MNNLYRGPSKDASYQVSIHLAKRFRGEDFKKSANQKQKLTMAAMFVNGSGQNEQSLDDLIEAFNKNETAYYMLIFKQSS
jgi:uncharacterized alpha/beta hydrolase family protein